MLRKGGRREWPGAVSEEPPLRREGSPVTYRPRGRPSTESLHSSSGSSSIADTLFHHFQVLKKTTQLRLNITLRSLFEASVVAERVKRGRRIAGPCCMGADGCQSGKGMWSRGFGRGHVDSLPGWRGRTLESQSGKLTGSGSHLSPLSSFICTSNTAIYAVQFEHHL